MADIGDDGEGRGSEKQIEYENFAVGGRVKACTEGFFEG